jgi:hypothetical protein
LADPVTLAAVAVTVQDQAAMELPTQDQAEAAEAMVYTKLAA